MHAVPVIIVLAVELDGVVVGARGEHIGVGVPHYLLHILRVAFNHRDALVLLVIVN